MQLYERCNAAFFKAPRYLGNYFFGSGEGVPFGG